MATGRGENERRPRLNRSLPWIVAGLSAALLVAHSFKWDKIEVDGVTLGLLAALLVTSRWDLVRRLKIGEFEAEIDPAEVAKTQAKVATEIGPPEDRDADEYQQIVDLVRSDPTLGLAKLRIEIERVLQALYGETEPGARRRPFGIGQLARALAARHEIAEELVGPLLEVAALANRAVHGETVRRDDAETIALLGVRLLNELRESYVDRFLKPVATEHLTTHDVDTLREQQYRLVTVVPLIEEPRKNIRILDQEALDQFFEGYGEFAEFVVSIEPRTGE